MKRVDDWISNLYPNGYSFSHYKSNFTSSIDLEFSIKGDNFEGCKTEQDLKDQIEDIMEVKYPIYTSRMDAINPTLRSNEEANSFLKRTLVNFTDAKMAQARWQNLLTHLILKNLPDSDVFKKQHDFLSSYLSKISINKGGTAKADLEKIEKNIIRIKVDLRSKGQPTCQVIQSGRNLRTFQGEEKNEEKYGICNRKGHTDKECRSPCWNSQKTGHRNHDCPTKKSERGRTQSRNRG